MLGLSAWCPVGEGGLGQLASPPGCFVNGGPWAQLVAPRHPLPPEREDVGTGQGPTSPPEPGSGRAVGAPMAAWAPWPEQGSTGPWGADRSPGTCAGCPSLAPLGWRHGGFVSSAEWWALQAWVAVLSAHPRLSPAISVPWGLDSSGFCSECLQVHPSLEVWCVLGSPWAQGERRGSPALPGSLGIMWTPQGCRQACSGGRRPLQAPSGRRPQPALLLPSGGDQAHPAVLHSL